MVDPVKHLAKVKEAGSQITTRIIKLGESVVDEIEYAVSGGRSCKNPSAPAKLFERPGFSGVKKSTGQYCLKFNLA